MKSLGFGFLAWQDIEEALTRPRTALTQVIVQDTGARATPILFIMVETKGLSVIQTLKGEKVSFWGHRNE